MSCRRVASDRWRLAAVVMLLSSSTHTAFGAPPPPPLTAEQTTDSVAFIELDGNEDGFLSGKEAVSVLAYDTNGDKRVTKAEFMAARELARGVDPAIEDGKQFLKLDGNEDGWLSGKEMKGLERFDANSDGEITEEEFLAGRAADRAGKPAAKPLASTPASLNSFLAAVAQRNAKSLLSQMHPVLRDQVDEPVLQFFVDAIHTELGAMSDDEPSDVKQDKQEADGSPIITTTATIEFAHGQANCELVIQEKAITGFSINSDKLTELDQKLGERLVKDDQFAKQVGQFYAPRGESMLTLIFQGKGEQVHAMLHPEVQQQLSLETINAECRTARNLSGALKNIEYDGFTEVFDADTGSFKKITVNYKLECENGSNDAKVIIQFVGLSGALVGFEVTKGEDVTPAPAVDENFKVYRNKIEDLSEKHAGNFVPFAFTYPAAWTIDSEAGTEESPNVVKVMRDAKIGNGLTFTQENFAVGSCQVSGTGELAKLGLQYLSEQFQQAIAKGFPEYKLNRNGDMKFGEYEGYGFDFTSKLPHPNKGKVDCWGRVILLAPSVIGQDHGLSIVMLATSEAPELTSLADLGVKGELPVIIRSFKVGDAAEVPEPAPQETPFSNAKAAAHYDRAVELVGANDLDGAIAALTDAINLEPRNSQGYLARGNTRYQNQDLAGAAADYTLAIQVDPMNVDAHNNRGVMHYYLDDLTKAMLDYEQAIKLNPEYGLAYSNRGLVKLLRNQDAAAQLDFDKALELSPGAEFAAQQAEDIREAKLRRSKATPPPTTPPPAPPRP